MDPAPSAPAVPETTTCGKTADFPNYEAACGMGDYQDSTGSCEPCDPCCQWGGGCSGGSPGTADCTSCFYKGGPPPATATCDKSCPAKCKEQVEASTAASLTLTLTLTRASTAASLTLTLALTLTLTRASTAASSPHAPAARSPLPPSWPPRPRTASSPPPPVSLTLTLTRRHP